MCAASGRPDEAFPWILATEKQGVTLEDFADSGDFPTLDVKLAAAISKLAKGELGHRLAHETELAAKQGKLIRGRQAMFLIHPHHPLDEEHGALYSIRDVLAVRLGGDSKLESFINSWDHVIAGLMKPMMKSCWSRSF